MRDRRTHRAGLRGLYLERLEERSLLAVGVASQVETASASGADDVAIWIHPTDVSQSVIIGAIKTSSTSLRVYNLAGQQIQSVPVAQINNVDLRYSFPLNGQRIALLAGSNRSDDSIALYQIDSHGLLHNVAARTISTGMEIYGCTMYFSVATGNYYAFVSSEAGQVQQWELFDNGAGKVDARMVRSFSVGSIAEGMVADDVLGTLYIGEENRGIWRYDAEPSGGAIRTSIDTIGSGGRLTADVEGLTIYYKPEGVGYLIASSQGSNEYAVYRREGANDYVGNFRLIAGNGIDAVGDTDGIDVTNFGLGPQFPAGMFVAQDSDENFKLARWDAIDTAFGELVSGNGAWDPRQIGVQSSGYLGQWKADYGKSSGSDLNGDGVSDGSDFLLWQRSFTAIVTTSAALPAATTVIANSQSTDFFAVGVPQDTVAYLPPEQAAKHHHAQEISAAISDRSLGPQATCAHRTCFTQLFVYSRQRSEPLSVDAVVKLQKAQDNADRIMPFLLADVASTVRNMRLEAASLSLLPQFDTQIQ